MTEVERAIRDNTRKMVLEWLGGLRIEPELTSITGWAEGNRYLPEGTTERPGMFSAAFCPYVLEIQECFHPDSPIRTVSTLKGTQSLMTTSHENVIGHSIKYGLHNILYVISTKSMAGMRSSAAIDILIDYSGLKEYIRPMTRRANQRKGGDTILYKELAGGRRLFMTGYKSIADLKSFSWDLIVMDEIDEAPPYIKGQGDPEALIEARGKTIEGLKIAKLSTPTQAQGSRIYKAFKAGDQREYLIPCPRCGGYQHLEMMKDGREYGLYGDYSVDGKTKKAVFVENTERYRCRHCGKDFFEYEKTSFMLEKSLGGPAYWEPQGTARDPRDRSYHVSSMMSPMTSWKNILIDWAKTDFGKKLQDCKSFVINTEGLPFFTNQRQRAWDELKERAEDYPLGQVPDGGLLVTGGVDVHKNRLELQLVAWGYGLEAWSFDYRQFFGETADVNGPAWRELEAYCSHYYAIPGTNAKVYITRLGVDASYNPNKDPGTGESMRREMNAVYAFCKRYPVRFVPVRGVDGQKNAAHFITQKKIHRLDTYYYVVDVDAVKDEIFNGIDLKEGGRAVHFPSLYPDEFFKQFLSEVYAEDDTGKMAYKKIYERNEALDTFVYARAVASIIGADRWNEDQWDVWRMGLME
ncbi:MAG: phage terminase large subunit family protein [Spirochaetaceae bacterium]|jgi:phage terminase large subunit GpA-like protein|nr:phage terminase large subunit family protein [Spirochaetaceae bacterium]